MTEHEKHVDEGLVDAPFSVRADYTFEFVDGTTVTFPVQADLTSNTMETHSPNRPSWVALDCRKCEHCPLSKKESPECPAALSVVDVVEYFSKNFTQKLSKCVVTLPGKSVTTHKNLRESLSSLIGLRLGASLCPYLSQFKPMARFHEPFSTPYETVYRSTSMYLLKQYFQYKEGKPADWDMKGLKTLYEQVSLVNLRLSERLKSAEGFECQPCSMDVLSVFTLSMTLLLEEHLKILRELCQ